MFAISNFQHEVDGFDSFLSLFGPMRRVKVNTPFRGVPGRVQYGAHFEATNWVLL